MGGVIFTVVDFQLTLCSRPRGRHRPYMNNSYLTIIQRFQQWASQQVVGMMALAPGETFLNNEVRYRSVVSQNEIAWVFKIFDIFLT